MSDNSVTYAINFSMSDGATQFYMPGESDDTVGGAPSQPAGAAAPAAPQSAAALETSGADTQMESEETHPLCRIRGCGMTRWISPKGRVTTQCRAHNVVQYSNNIPTGGTQLLNLCDESCYHEIEKRMTAGIEDLIATRAELRRRWGPRQQ